MDRSQIFRQYVYYGSIIGIAYVLLVLLFYWAGNNLFTTDKEFLATLPLFLEGLILYFSILNIERVSEKTFNFGKFLLTGLLIGIFAAILVGLFNAIFITKIATETLNFYYDTIDKIYKNWVTTEQIDLLKQMIANPFVMFFSQFFGQIFNILIILLFFGIFRAIFPKPKI